LVVPQQNFPRNRVATPCDHYPSPRFRRLIFRQEAADTGSHGPKGTQNL
jgi:hypothetical protein